MATRSTASKPLLWMLLADLQRGDLHWAIPSIAWMAADVGAVFECYLECQRDGRLFAETGSTVLGGGHYQQFNYLLAAFDVRFILLGRPSVFASSIERFGAPVLARGDSPAELYPQLLALEGVGKPQAVIVGPDDPVRVGEGGDGLRLDAYLFPEILYRRGLAFPAAQAERAAELAAAWPVEEQCGLLLSEARRAQVAARLPALRIVEEVNEDDDFGTITLRIARRWKHEARGVVFGDPPAVLSQLATHCAARRVAVFAPRQWLPPERIICSGYAESTSPIAAEAAALALEIGNPVLVGRQTGDGDLFRWSEQGVCIEIIDPNRPAFPSVAASPCAWKPDGTTLFDLEPDDAQLARWADEGKVLATLIWHSGEVAHNEAMANLIELASWSGVKMGIGVHAQRYETCPQTWELINVPRQKGGVKGLIEPVLHSGGLGVLAECNCPPEMLARHCRESLGRIARIAGPAGTPRGYYAFMDSDLPTLSAGSPAVYDAIESAGLEYVISSALPGRNRLIRRTSRCAVLNQSCRVVHGASPFVRITTSDDLNTSAHTQPGWLIATLDAPVVAFAPYIWRRGWKLMEIVDRLTRSGQFVNVTPRTIARYARLLHDRQLVPAAGESAEDSRP